ncbi:GGDEF domain-containing protein [Sphingobium sufflavum]|uniref:GGDEF domain-containing protein n=1 Tax=Sphingobium sufflavum TaxID=1129547 RepID=UPI001F2CF916|nr:GGDEF domain-containing protein [Sphingobium sufflavum]MCE7795227.1 GGDEF domain-containing protein [Sphingobium sufflavum]
MIGSLLLILQALLYFAVMATLFRARRTMGMGVFVCALGVMHFLETYLAAVFFIELPFGLISPGSTVMFAGKLAMILMLYIREDAETVRQPIYGLLMGNFLMVALAGVLRFYTPMELPGGVRPDLTLLDQLGALMIWGTTLLFIDSIAIILLYERLERWVGRAMFPRAALSLIVILSFDQLGFFAGLHLMTGTPAAALLGGWMAKMAAAILYAIFISAYLHLVERHDDGTVHADGQRLSDIFAKLTYRHRYEALLRDSGIDALTGVLNRSQFETSAQASVARALSNRRPISLAIVDVDHFKQINDRHGHVTGDDVLRQIAQALRASVRANDRIFRYGGEEFVVLSEGMNHETALIQAERLRAAVPAAFTGSFALAPTVSIGLATAPGDGSDLMDLIRHADRHLYQAKHDGRNRVVGNNAPDGEQAG